MAVVFIPSALRRLTGGVERAPAAGRTVREVIDDLERRFPGFRAAVTEHGELSPSLAVFVDGEMSGEGLLAAVGDGSEVHFVPALGGGTAVASHPGAARAAHGRRPRRSRPPRPRTRG